MVIRNDHTNTRLTTVVVVNCETSHVQQLLPRTLKQLIVIRPTFTTGADMRAFLGPMLRRRIGTFELRFGGCDPPTEGDAVLESLGARWLSKQGMEDLKWELGIGSF